MYVVNFKTVRILELRVIGIFYTVWVLRYLTKRKGNMSYPQTGVSIQLEHSVLALVLSIFCVRLLRRLVQ